MTKSPVFPIFAAGVAFATLISPLAGQDDLTFEDFSKKLEIDGSPIERGGVMNSYADMLEGVTPAVVTIFAKREPDPQMREMMDDPLFRRLFPQDAPPDRVTGSGVIISEDGYVLTNNHVVEHSEDLRVILEAEGKEFDAKLIVADPKSDVALLKIDASGLKAMKLGDSAQLRVGDTAFAVGNPFGLTQTVTMGIISALGRSSGDVPIVDYANFIQTDASVNRGNSGGALVDAHGRLIGINTAIQGGFNGGNVGVAFAIPVNMALDIVDRLLEGGGVVKRGFLGVRLQPLDRDLAEGLGWRESYGVVVADVVEGTPAAKAGLKANDIVLGYQGEKAREPDSLRLQISNTPPNEEVEFEVFRDGKKLKVKVMLAELPDDLTAFRGTPNPFEEPEQLEFLDGVEISNVTDEKRAEFTLDEDVEGVVVVSVEPDSTAADAGLRAGQVILEVNRKKIETVQDAGQAREDFDGEVLLVRVSDGGARSILAVRVDEKKDE